MTPKEAIAELHEAVKAEARHLEKLRAEADRDRCFWEILAVENGEWRLVAIVYDPVIFGEQRKTITSPPRDADAFPMWFLSKEIGHRVRVREVKLRGEF